MTRLTITIETNGDAFVDEEDKFGEVFVDEVQRCLEQVYKNLVDRESGGTILDSNGNDTGHWEIEDETI